MRRHPHLYEINTWPWLRALSQRHGRRVTLGTVPEDEWDALRARGIDLVYLMGIWERSTIGRRIARSDPGAWAAYDAACPGWHIDDVVGSAFSISGYVPDPAVGGFEGLDRARATLHARDMRLIVDFIPNHFGFDHPWTHSHPDRFIQGSEDAFRASPTSFRLVELEENAPCYIARARDPHFLPWSDVAQLDYSNPDTRRAMTRELQTIAQHADGARCDMAMLVLSDVFSGTWRMFVEPWKPDREFWTDARAAVPDFLLLAEVYWDMEWRLQELGFDFTYDKRLYDRLLRDEAGSVEGHLRADPSFQNKSARFIENHDEQRSTLTFGRRVRACAVAASTVPGLRFYYDGQFEGRRVRLPMQLGLDVEERVDPSLAAFYDRLTSAADQDVFHAGEWSLCAVERVDGSHGNILAWRWRLLDELRLVAVNLGDVDDRTRVDIVKDLPAGEWIAFDNVLDGRHEVVPRHELAAGGAAIFAITSAPRLLHE